MIEVEAAVAVPAVSHEGLRFARPAADAPSVAMERLAVAAGERVFLCGPSGSGKTTLLSLIGGVLEAQAGRVVVCGQDLGVLRAGARDRFRADHIGFVFQLFNLIPYLSARDNILLPCRFSALRSRRVREAGRSPEAEAERLAAHLDLDRGLLDRPAAELSVGQQQRVAAARALIGRPPLVIADEPTSALDADRQRGFLELLLGECAAAGAALIFVSHDARQAAHNDRVVALDEINRAAGGGGA